MVLAVIWECSGRVNVHRFKWVVLSLALTAASASAQSAAVPDADGVYSSGKGLTPAEIVNAATAAYPADAGLTHVKHVCSLSVVVGADGTLGKIESRSMDASPFDEGAIAAVRQSQFKPAIFQGHAVPSRLAVWVPFVGGQTPSVPVSASANRDKLHPPVPLNSVEAEYPKGAINQGSSIVTLIVAEDGTPTDVRIVRSLGPEFDENTLAAAAKYHFKPATLFGVPMPTRITVEVNFRK
jgi:TonB family protein